MTVVGAKAGMNRNKNNKGTATIAGEAQSHCQLNCSNIRGDSKNTSTLPTGIHNAQTPIDKPMSLGFDSCEISVGADTEIKIIPMPSITLLASN